MFKILIAEDDTNLRDGLILAIKKAGYEVKGVSNGKEALKLFIEEHFDLVVTDVMMPIMDGIQLTKFLKEDNKNLPILMLTALDTLDDKETGFNSGADDYLCKPFALKELLLRIKALLRRYEKAYENVLVFPNTKLVYSTASVYVNENKVELTKKEFLLLFKLVSNPDVIFSRDQLINEIWGFDCTSYDRTIDTHIKVLREKVKSLDFTIETVRGLGYKVIINGNEE